MKKNSPSLPPTCFDRAVGGLIARRLADFCVTTRLWDHHVIGEPDHRSPSEITFLKRSALLRSLFDPGLGLAEAYADGALEFSGDLVRVLEAANRAAAPQGKLGHSWRTHVLASHVGRRSARRNARSHYDLGNDFFSLWLDSTMTYTCAYFDDEQATLEQAQRAKMDYICRKLALASGETVVEAGCGWGGLALFMAKRYGVRVRAFNVSTAQIEFARDQARRQQLDSRIEFIEDDYRSISGSYDAFVSVGMLEAVGSRDYAEFGAIITKCLSPNGRGLLHTIGRSQPYPPDRWITRHVFPGSYYPSLKEISRVFEPAGLVITDIENLRQHYVLTLDRWLERFEAAAPEIAEMFSQAFVRMWRLYLSAACAAFRSGWLQLYQVVFTHADNTTALPMRVRRDDRNGR